jgi:hypothetical protein
VPLDGALRREGFASLPKSSFLSQGPALACTGPARALFLLLKEPSLPGERDFASTLSP